MHPQSEEKGWISTFLTSIIQVVSQGPGLAFYFKLIHYNQLMAQKLARNLDFKKTGIKMNH